MLDRPSSPPPPQASPLPSGSLVSSRNLAAESVLSPSGRDTRLDVCRALCLLMIFINHVPGQYLEYLTTKNFGFSDSAEAFVLISGLSVALAYGRKFVPSQRLFVTLKALRRAFTLYVAHIMTSIMTLAIFAAGALYFGRQDLIGEINIRPIVENTEQGIVAMVLLGHQLGYNNILSLYAALFLMVPGILWLQSKSKTLLLLSSASVWLAAGVFKIVPPNFLDEGYWFLNPFSWQFIFVIGIVAMTVARERGELPRLPALTVVAGAYVALSCLWVVFSWWNLERSFGLPPVLTGFDKTFLSVSRLLHALALAYVIVTVPAINNRLRLPEDHPLVLVGRHSLPIFIFGTILAMGGQVLLFVVDRNMVIGTLYVASGIFLHFAYARYLTWLKKAQRPVAVAS